MFGNLTNHLTVLFCVHIYRNTPWDQHLIWAYIVGWLNFTCLSLALSKSEEQFPKDTVSQSTVFLTFRTPSVGSGGWGQGRGYSPISGMCCPKRVWFLSSFGLKLGMIIGGTFMKAITLFCFPATGASNS